MKIFLKYLFKNVMEKKVRSFIIILALSLTTFLLYINLNIRDYFEYAYHTHIEETYGDVDIVVTPNGDNPILDVDSLNLSNESIKDELNIFYSQGSLMSTEELVRLNVFGAPLQETLEFGLLQLDTTKSNDEFQDNQVIISEEWAQEGNYKVGDTLELSLNQSSSKYTVYAIAPTTGLFSQDHEMEKSLLIPFDNANEAYGLEQAVNLIYLSTTGEKTFDQVVTELKNQNSSATITSVYDDERMENQTSTILIALLFVLLILIVISVYIIYSLFGVIIIERMAVIGTFKSVGATHWQIRFLLLVESFLFGVIGSLLGIVFGVLVSQYLFEFLNNYGTITDGYVNPRQWLYMGLTIVFTTIVSIVSTFIPVLSLRSSTIRNVLTKNETGERNYLRVAFPLGALFIAVAAILTYFNTQYHLLMGLGSIMCMFIGGILLLPYIVRIIVKILKSLLRFITSYNVQFGLKNVVSSKFSRGNITLVTVSLTLIITIYTVVLGVQNYMLGISSANDFDISITSLEEDTSVYTFLEKEPSIDSIYEEYLGFEKLQTGNDTTGSITYIGLDKQQNFKEFHTDGVDFKAEDAESLFTGNYILVDKFILKLYDLQIGESIEIITESGQSAPYEIIGVMNAENFATDRKVAMISLDNFKQDIATQPFQLLIKTNTGAELEQVSNEIKEQLIDTSSQVRTLEENIEESMHGVDNLFFILNVLIVLAISLVGFGIVNNLVVSFLQRQRELSILYSVSMSRGQLVRMFLIETISASVIAGIVAFGLSFTISKLLPNFLWGIGIAFNFDYPYQFALTLFVVVTIILLLTIFIPIIKLANTRVVDFLRYD